jgi:Protein of unknown function (DUF998)
MDLDTTGLARMRLGEHAIHTWDIAVALEPAVAPRPASCNPVRQTVGVLAGQGGTVGWIMIWALFPAGGCYLVTAAGLTGVRPPRWGFRK